MCLNPLIQHSLHVWNLVCFFGQIEVSYRANISYPQYPLPPQAWTNLRISAGGSHIILLMFITFWILSYLGLHSRASWYSIFCVLTSLPTLSRDIQMYLAHILNPKWPRISFCLLRRKLGIGSLQIWSPGHVSLNTLLLPLFLYLHTWFSFKESKLPLQVTLAAYPFLAAKQNDCQCLEVTYGIVPGC